MKNNLIKNGIIIILLVTFAFTGFVSGYKEENNINFDNIYQSYNENNEIIEYCYDYSQVSSSNYPVMEKPIPIVKTNENTNDITLNVENIPAEFSWTNENGKDWSSPVKNQGNCGSCWLFAAMGAFESVINIRENCEILNPDLSEQYVLSCMPEAGSCHGGNVTKCAFYFIMNTSNKGNYHNGVITEECFSYQSNFNYIPPCSDKHQNWLNFLVPILDYGENWMDINSPDFKNTIKSLIYEKGPLMAYFWASERFINWGAFHKDSSEYYPDTDENYPTYVNHGCTILGWKDDPSIGNGGYWICKNTWGPNWGYKGFFNIEYDYLNMGGFIAWVDYDPNSYDWSPVANAGSFYRGESDREIIFDGSLSVDPEGEIEVYLWDFGDDSFGDGITSSHTYYESGIYPVTLTVKDNNGQEKSHTTIVGVDIEPLQIDISGGIGIDIAFTNPVDVELSNWEYDIKIDGLVIPNRISGIFKSIPSYDRVNLLISVFGLGFGILEVSIEDISITKNILIIGPLVIIRDNFM